jgi:hypothetical protein
MVGPDLLGCPEHGLADWSTYGAERRSYCRACRRARESATHFGGPRCQRGHLKTPWTWRLYSAGFRCLTCEYERRRARRQEREVAA